MTEQRYQAILAVIRDGSTVTDVASRFGVSRKTVHQWLARYEADGLGGLADRSQFVREVIGVKGRGLPVGFRGSVWSR